MWQLVCEDRAQPVVVGLLQDPVVTKNWSPPTLAALIRCSRAAGAGSTRVVLVEAVRPGPRVTS